MTQGSTRTVRREACSPPWYTRLWATTVRAEAKPSRVLLLGKMKFLALEVTVTRMRWPFRKQLDSLVADLQADDLAFLQKL